MTAVGARWLVGGVAILAVAIVIAWLVMAGWPDGAATMSTPGWSAPSSPPSPSPVATADPLPALPAADAVADIDWHQLPSVEVPDSVGSEVRVGSITAIGDRLFVDGRAADGLPRIWFSDEGARTWDGSWQEATIDWSPARGEIPQEGGIYEIAGTPDRLVATGWRAAAGPADERDWAAWISSDGGRHWTPLPAGAGPEAEALLWTGSRFLAFRVGSDAPFAAWSSNDGQAWTQMDGETPLGTHRAHPELATHGGRVVGLLAPPGSNALEIWTTTDDAEWVRPERDGRAVTAVAVQSGLFGFVAVDRVQGNPPGLVVLRSADGVTWTRQTIRLERPGSWPDPVHSWWLADGPDGLVISAVGQGTFDPIFATWFLPHGDWRGDWVGGFRGTIWQGEAFFARGLACADSVLLAGLRGGMHNDVRPDLKTCLPGPDPMVIGLPIREVPDTITGTWSGSGCSYIQEPGGHLWRIRWPPGYRTGYRDETPETWPDDYRIVLHAPDGSVVSPDGGRIRVRGERVEGGEVCTGGVPYGVSEILEASPEG